jgi:hydroxymethylbilane synthase
VCSSDLLAYAGLNRLGLTEYVKQVISVDVMLPSACQGSLGIEISASNIELKEKLAFLNDADTSFAVKAERAFLNALSGGCNTPVACYAKIDGDEMCVRCYLGNGESVALKDEISGPKSTAEALGKRLGEKIINQGGREILEKLHG